MSKSKNFLKFGLDKYKKYIIIIVFISALKFIKGAKLLWFCALFVEKSLNLIDKNNGKCKKNIV